MAIMQHASTPVYAPLHTEPQPTDADVAVVFRGDGEPQTARGLMRRLAAFEDEVGIVPDSFARGGTVERLEQRFAELLGKEAAVFMPTGTLANHLAIRRLCGVKPRAVVPGQSHLYNDTGDCVPRLSGINLIPLAPGRPYFTLAELHEALQQSVTGRVRSPVGAVLIESPMRRQHGQIMPYEAMVEVTRYCQEQGIATHLDGARLYMMSAATGISPQQYACHFDTVYVSLYKYFGAPFGAILAGPGACLNDLYHERRMFGGGLAAASLAAALALQGLEGFAARFGAAMAKAADLIARLNEREGIRVGRFPHGSNIFPVELDPRVDVETFLAALHRSWVFLFPDEGNAGQIHLTVNTTILRQPNEAILTAFERALCEGLKSS
jgi:threonine aldolase